MNSYKSTFLIFIWICSTFTAISINGQTFSQISHKSVDPIKFIKNERYFDSGETFFLASSFSDRINISADTLMIDSIISRSVSGSGLRVTFSYNSSGKIDYYIIADYFDGDWENDWRITNFYDSLGHLSSALHEAWNSGRWYNSDLELFSYDADDNLIKHILQAWENDGWVNWSQTIYSYSCCGDLIETLSSNWDGSSWRYFIRALYRYLQNGLADDFFIEKWSDSSWVNFSHSTFKYDHDDNLILIEAELWDGTAWRNAFRLNYSYYEHAPQLSALEEEWNGENWENSRRYFYSYTDENYFLYGYNENWLDGVWTPGEGVIDVENPDGFSIHFITYSVEVYYRQITEIDGSPAAAASEYKLSQNYPNPFNPNTKIKFTLPESGFVNLTVYNSIGEKVAELVNEQMDTGTYEKEFTAGNLSSGIYFYRLSAGAFSSTMKMILLK